MKLSNAKVSLDVESVLAAILPPFIKVYNEQNDAEITESWSDWNFSDAPFSPRDFFKITGKNWKHNPLAIQPLEENLASKTRGLFYSVGQLDVVTGREGFDEEIKMWLDHHSIYYDSFYSVNGGKSKAELGYDYYIDDKPALAREINDRQHLCLYDHPYNKDIRQDDNVSRVTDLQEALDVLNLEAGTAMA